MGEFHVEAEFSMGLKRKDSAWVYRGGVQERPCKGDWKDGVITSYSTASRLQGWKTEQNPCTALQEKPGLRVDLKTWSSQLQGHQGFAHKPQF
jgi:hypothetical protein